MDQLAATAPTHMGQYLLQIRKASFLDIAPYTKLVDGLILTLYQMMKQYIINLRAITNYQVKEA